MRSLWNAELQCSVIRLGLASTYYLSLVAEELCHPADSTTINSEPSSQYVHEDVLM